MGPSFDAHAWVMFASAALGSNAHGTDEARIASAASVADKMLEELEKRERAASARDYEGRTEQNEYVDRVMADGVVARTRVDKPEPEAPPTSAPPTAE